MAFSLLEEFELPLELLPLADVIEKQIKKLKGVKAKELMLWPPVSETVLDDDPPTGKIHFKSLAAIKKTLISQWRHLQPDSEMHQAMLGDPLGCHDHKFTA
ncbi:hypothetical protein SLEP1_g7910 [Rubroshorea leprosula]|uniref:Uncharacterized protein n=1 Tax=Rubroshorea leprosula TaxID=152421 RepID=A0AAV5I965_9ROSI|nr:hypothetical protein SLEP1_g7910 [Rubroshorea leprosula]